MQNGNEILLLPEDIKGNRYQEYKQNKPTNYGKTLQILDSHNKLENVVELMEDEDEDVIDLRRQSTTPQSNKDYFEKSQVRVPFIHSPSFLYMYGELLYNLYI